MEGSGRGWVGLNNSRVGRCLYRRGWRGGWSVARRSETRRAGSRQRQFQAGADLLSAAYGFIGSAAGLQTVLETPELTGEVNTVYQRYLGRWDSYVDKFGVARLAAHPDVVQAARIKPLRAVGSD